MKNLWAVIGAGSFYGQHFIDVLERAGDGVIAIARPRFDLVRSGDAILELLAARRPDYVVNFAALNVVDASWQFFDDYYRTNVIGLANLVDGLVGQDWLRRFVQVSTPEVFGEVGGARIRPDAGFNPSTPYAVSRAAGDMHLAALQRVKGFPVVFTRTVNIYGPRQQPYRIVPRAALACAGVGKLRLEGGGTTWRSFIHVRDACEAVRLVGLHGRPGRGYHIATSKLTRIRDLVETICGIAGARFDDVVEDAPARGGQDNAYVLNDDETRGELQWTDDIPLDVGLQETVRWYLERSGEYAAHHLRHHHRP